MIGWNQPAGQVHLAQSGRRREWAPTHAICLSAVGLLVSILLSYSPVLAAETGAPTRTIQEAVNRVMTILADPDWRKSERSRERKRLVDQPGIVVPPSLLVFSSQAEWFRGLVAGPRDCYGAGSYCSGSANVLSESGLPSMYRTAPLREIGPAFFH